MARWKFLIGTVPFNPGAKPKDSWAAFQTERAEIIDFITNHKITGIFAISGDMHIGGALDDGSNSRFPELQVRHANLPSPVCHSAPVYEIGSWSLGIRCGIDNSGYGLITVTPDSVVLQPKGVDGAVRLSFIVGGDH
jgi:alkaline phosphatase D